MSKKDFTGNHNTLVFGTLVKGDITTDSDIRIDGTVEGHIECAGRVIIGQQGRVQGTINCANADILGTLVGNIEASDTISVHATGRLEGDMRTVTLAIEPKAYFYGSCLTLREGENEQKEK